MEQHGVDESRLPTGRIVRASDVMALVPRGTPTPVDVASSRVVIYGASLGGLVALECLRAMGGYEAVAFLDRTPEKIGTVLQGLPVWPEEVIGSLRERGVGGVVTHIARRDFRVQLLERTRSLGLALPNVIHPRAFVSGSVSMGVGNLIKAGALVDTETRLGSVCLIDNGAVVPHHCQIGDACHLAPGACMGGECRIGERTLLGVGCVVASAIRIGRNVIVAPGACVVRDVEDNVVVEGSPARVVGKRR
jgi:UDP-perosamine 4-acetyltransferase